MRLERLPNHRLLHVVQGYILLEPMSRLQEGSRLEGFLSIIFLLAFSDALIVFDVCMNAVQASAILTFL